MAQCSQCKTNVGCGCQLINGLCAYCNGLLNSVKTSFKNVISKTY
jgi:hypothetical protein